MKRVKESGAAFRKKRKMRIEQEKRTTFMVLLLLPFSRAVQLYCT